MLILMPDRELEDYERLHLLDSMYIQEKMLEEEEQYYEYTRKVSRQREVGRKRTHDNKTSIRKTFSKCKRCND